MSLVSTWHKLALALRTWKALFNKSRHRKRLRNALFGAAIRTTGADTLALTQRCCTG